MPHMRISYAIGKMSELRSLDSQTQEARHFFRKKRTSLECHMKIRRTILHAGLIACQVICILSCSALVLADSVQKDRELGFDYLNGRNGLEKDYSKAFAYLLKAAEMGDAESQFAVGKMCEDGLGVEKNVNSALKWYQMAADQGNSNAAVNLGGLYILGKEIKQSYPTALKWFYKAAEQGNKIALFNIGVMYHDGMGVEKNDVYAAEWFQKAAEKGLKKAKLVLVDLYLEGRGVKQDIEEALKWFESAGEEMNSRDLMVKGRIQEGRKNYLKAVLYYRIAASKGDLEAVSKIGRCYEKMEKTPQNCANAIHWYTKGAERGYTLCMLSLGFLHWNGTCVPQNRFLGGLWFRKAARKDDVGAKVFLKGHGLSW